VKIDDISAVVAEIPWRAFSPMATGRPGAAEWGVLKIRTDDGIEGYGSLSAPGEASKTTAAEIMRVVKPVLLGRDPLDIGTIWSELWRRRRFFGGPVVVGSVDMALWDIAGKAAGFPIHRLLGTHRGAVPAYKSDPVPGGPAAYAEDVLRWKDLGWTGYKYHSRGKPNEDLVVLAAIREAAGDDICLMLDAHAYPFGDAVRVGKAIEEMGYFWYEDPMAPEDIYGHRKLKEQVGIPILATETTEGGLYTFAQWITAKATDAIRGDWAVKGGITALIKAAHLAEAFNINLEVHYGYGFLGNLANLQVIMATRNCSFFEAMGVNPPGATGPEVMNFGLTDPITVGADGLIQAPTLPGLGSDVDWDLIKTFGPTEIR
jgi:L-alanine-DL-glutamate epimerase-like enolase superfamily enzyme